MKTYNILRRSQALNINQQQHVRETPPRAWAELEKALTYLALGKSPTAPSALLPITQYVLSDEGWHSVGLTK